MAAIVERKDLTAWKHLNRYALFEVLQHEMQAQLYWKYFQETGRLQ